MSWNGWDLGGGACPLDVEVAFSSWWARRTFLSNLPTLVFGDFVDEGPLAPGSTTSRLCLPSGLGGVGRDFAALFAHDVGERAFVPLLVRNADDRRFGDLGCAMISFSSSTEEIHSPPDLITSLLRSVICT